MKTGIARWALTVLLFLLTAGIFASATYADQGDPPARVARLSVAEGKVSFQPSGETAWSEAVVNRPVTTGDRVYADQGSRAELEVGPFVVRLSQATDVTLANLTDQLMQLGLGQGTVRVTIYDLPANNSVEIDTPNGALMLQAVGSYRVDTAADGNSTQVTVNVGTLQISAGDLSKTLQSGQAVKLTGTGPVAAAEISVPPADEFDQWCAGRDHRVENSPTVKSVGPAVPGGEDLDAYGQWSEQPDYGQVWVPAHMPPDWVPYRYGHWVFIEPWGWTWVEAEPWGYAPFHYGRWAHIGPVWAWVPGPMMVRPVYAPALVAFVGGPGFGISIGVGVQAWFPLGPREPFMPWYHYGPTYIRQVNVVNLVNVTNVRYMNRGVAVTAVSGEAFRGGQPVRGAMVRVAPEQLARARVIPHPEVTPAPRAVFGSRAVAAPPVPAGRFGNPRPAAVATPSGPRTFTPESHVPVRPGGPTNNPPPQVCTRNAPDARGGFRTGGPTNTPPPHVFTRNTPAPTNPPFAVRQDAYSEHPGRALEPQQMNNLRAGKPAGPMQDKEVVPHPAKAQPQPKAPPSHGEHH